MNYRSIILAAGLTLASALSVQAAPLAPAASAFGASGAGSPDSPTAVAGEGLLHLVQRRSGGRAFGGGGRGPGSGFAGPRVRGPGSGVYRSAPRAYRAPRYRAPGYRGPVYRGPVYRGPAYRARPRVRVAPPAHIQRYRYRRPGYVYHYGGWWYPFAWWTYHYSPYYHYTPAPVYRARPRMSSRCVHWHRQCVARWGYSNPNYRGCMRYHRC